MIVLLHVEVTADGEARVVHLSAAAALDLHLIRTMPEPERQP